MTTTNTPAHRPKGRSPSYPAIDLEAAIDRAVSALGAGAPTSNASGDDRRTLGIQVAQWSRGVDPCGPEEVRIAGRRGGRGSPARTPDRSCRGHTGEPDVVRAASYAIRTAALNPTIHRDLWKDYGEKGLPSDQSLHWELTRDRKFTRHRRNRVPEGIPPRPLPSLNSRRVLPSKHKTAATGRVWVSTRPRKPRTRSRFAIGVDASA